jgi:hypothetical protein
MLLINTLQGCCFRSFLHVLAKIGRFLSPMTGWFDAGRIRIRLPGWAFALARLSF